MQRPRGTMTRLTRGLIIIRAGTILAIDYSFPGFGLRAKIAPSLNSRELVRIEERE